MPLQGIENGIRRLHVQPVPPSRDHLEVGSGNRALQNDRSAWPHGVAFTYE